MIALDLGDKTYNLAENWDDIVQLGKYLEVVRINYTHTEGQELEARQAMVAAITGLDGYELGSAAGAATKAQRNELRLSDFFAAQMLEEIYPVLDFIFEPELLTVNPLPVIKLQGISYYGPGEKLAAQTGAEMEECGQAHAEFIKTGDEQYLNQLVAAMYRPRWLLAGPCMAFSTALTARLTKRFAKLDPIVKRGVLLYYEMCEEWWRREFDFLYPAPQKLAEDEEPEIDSLAISKIIRALAGDKRGRVDDVRKMQRQEIYFELTELEREREALQK